MSGRIPQFAGMEVMATGNVRDNKALSRFELDAEGGLAFANYRLTPTAVIITHTETPRSLRGHGIASELVEGPQPAGLFGLAETLCHPLTSAGSLPPFAASLVITCLCSQTFMVAESLVSPV